MFRGSKALLVLSWHEHLISRLASTLISKNGRIVNIYFKKAFYKHQKAIFAWLEKPHVKDSKIIAKLTGRMESLGCLLRVKARCKFSLYGCIP